MLPEGERRELVSLARQVLLVVLVVVLVLAAWRLAQLLLFVFGGVLLAVVLARLAGLLGAYARLPRRWALTIVTTVLAAVVVGSGVLFGQQIAGQFGELLDRLAEGVERLNDVLGKAGLGGLRTQIGEAGRMLAGGLVSQVTGAATLLVELAAGTLIILFIGIYLAVNPDLYRRGILLLLPQQRQEQATEALDAMGDALWRWMIGQFITMLVVGVLITAALMLLGVPMALALGLLAGLLEFVPILGPWLAAIPAVLVGLTQGAATALWVALAYIVIQQIESYLLLPLIQRWAVALPPALTIANTTAFALLFGLVGVVFATPLTVAVLVAVRLLYVRDALGHDLGGKS